ncbi:hypothetical protein ASE63_02390 [Bosea sp. Root381]|nr:hypothetical protein ASE63_02390 [Bosea sp. Root381]
MLIVRLLSQRVPASPSQIRLVLLLRTDLEDCVSKDASESYQDIWGILRDAAMRLLRMSTEGT